MRQTGTGINGMVRILGCLSAVFGFSHVSHASSTHKHRRLPTHHVEPVRKPVVGGHIAAVRYTVHHVVHHTIIHHALVRHVVVHPTVQRLIRRPEMRTALDHAAFYHHAVYHRIEPRRPDYRHGYVAHRMLHRYIRRADYLWCVPYARDVSHIDLTGDAFLWWAEAAGRYDRGERPEPGAVLNFRSSARIPLGHVAVVAQVINSREILVDQANWVPDQVSRDVPVIDVSPNNNWSEVQVSIGDGRFGATYPTYGFIYDQQPGGGTIYAANSVAGARGSEVAEAPVRDKIRLIAPDRTLR